MRAIHVILSLPSMLVREAIRQELQKSGDVCVVAEVSSPLELICKAEIEQTDVVVLESDDGSEMPGMLSHLFAEFPHMTAIVVGRRRDQVVVYKQRVTEQVYERISMAELLTELRTADTEYWSGANE